MAVLPVARVPDPGTPQPGDGHQCAPKLARRGAAVMSEPVTDIYTAEVHTVTPQTPIEEVMRMMTERRVRHVPVVGDGGLRGIVSIGDVVKIRMGELETERTALTDYITGSR